MEWIDIKDKEPEEKGEYLFCYLNKKFGVGEVKVFTNNKSERWKKYYLGEMRFDDITHWMRIPQFRRR